MLVLSISLLVIGLILLLIEAMIPGFSVPGVTGILAIVISFVLTIIHLPVIFGLLVIFSELAIIIIVVYAVFKLLKRRQLISKLILDETLDYERNEVGGIEYFLGKEGITKTALRPFGSVDFNGFVTDVCSDGSFILVNKKVKVVSITDNKIIVKEVSELAN